MFSPRIIVTRTIPGSYVHKKKLYSAEDIIIDKVNDISVSTIDVLKEAVVAGKESGILKIEAENGFCLVLSLKDLLDEEDNLAAINKYQKSSLVDILKE